MQKESFDSICFSRPFIGEETQWFQCNVQIEVVNGYRISVTGDTSGDRLPHTNRHYLVIFDPSNRIVTKSCFPDAETDEYQSIDFADIMKAYNWCVVQSLKNEIERLEFLNS